MRNFLIAAFTLVLVAGPSAGAAEAGWGRGLEAPPGQRNAPVSPTPTGACPGNACQIAYEQLCRAGESGAKLFDVIDRRGAGRLTRADLDAFVDTLMSADTGAKGYITREDVIAAANRSLRNRIVCKLLLLYDANNDGTISQTELSRDAPGLINLDANRDGVIDSRDLELIGHASCMYISVRLNPGLPRPNASSEGIPAALAPFTVVPVTSGPGATTPRPGATTPSAGATASRPGATSSSASATTPSPGVVPPNPGVITPSPPPTGEEVVSPTTTTPVPGTASATGLGEESYLVPSGTAVPPGFFRGTVNQDISGNRREPLTLTPSEGAGTQIPPAAPATGAVAPTIGATAPEEYPGDEGELSATSAPATDGGYGRSGY